MDDAAIGRRVAAARKRAGIDKRKTLTDAADLPKVGPATLGKIERGERHLFPHEADAFAHALGVDRGFFYEEDIEPDITAQLEARLRAIELNVVARNDHDRIVEAMLHRQSQILTRIETLLSALAPEAGRVPDESVESLAPKGLQALRESLTPKPATQQPSEETHQQKRSRGRGA